MFTKSKTHGVIFLSAFLAVLFFVSTSIVFADDTLPPKIISISPTAVNRGNIVEVIGENFGGVYTGEVVIDSNRITDIEDWSDTKIRVAVRGFTGTGDLPFFIRSNHGGTGNLVDSNTVSLRVLQKSPKILSITPSKITPQGTTVEITGENFGATQATYGGKLFDIEYQGTHQILSWSDTRIRAIYNLELGSSYANIRWGGSYYPPSSYLQVRVKCLDAICNNYESGLGLANRPVDEYWSEGDMLSRVLIEAPICTSWTYSAWSTCSTNGQQARSVISASPISCDGGNPILSQSCTPPPPPPAPYVCYPNCDATVCVNDSCNQYGYMKAAVGDKISIVHRDLKLAKKITIGNVAIDSWNFKDDILEFFLPDNIKTGGVFVNVYHSDGNLISGGTLTVYLKSTLPPPSSCTADTWTCDAWSSCSLSGVQNRSCTKIFDCPTATTQSPLTSQSCAPPPKPITPTQPTCDADTWACDNWNSCSLSGIQNRSCRKTFDCSSVEIAPPSISEYCIPPNLEKYQVSPADQRVVNQSNIIKATVNLWCLQVNEKFYSVGSGTIIDPNGTILTNKHVVADTIGCRVGFVESYKDEPYFGDRHIADIIKTSTSADIAILKLRNPSKKILTYIDITKGSNDALSLEDKIITYGYPTAFGTKITSTRGDFSGVKGDFLKTTAIIDKGNSGGGAYLQNGTFIGMPTKIFPGTFNVLGGILSINKIKSWFSNAPVAYNNESNNKYSRVSSTLENIDLKKLGTLKLFISDTDAEGNNITPVIAPTTNQNAQKTTEQPKINQTQKESIIEPTDTNQKVNPEQNNLASPEKENDSSIKMPEQRKSIVANAIKEMIKVAESNGVIGQEIKTIAQTQTQNQEKLEIGIQKTKSRSGFAKFFIGPNYGEIKKSQKLLEQSKEQIQELNKLRTQIINQGDQLQIVEQVQLLEQANQQIENSLNEAQKGFSLFGWMFRLFIE